MTGQATAGRGGAHLLIHYAPGSRFYRFNLTAPENEVAPGTNPEPGTAPGNHPGPAGPSRGRETPHGSPAGDGGSAPVPGLPAPPCGAAQPGSAKITVTIWHNVALDGQGRHTAMLDGYQPGDPVVRVFAYQADPGQAAEEIAEEAFAICNGHPRDVGSEDLSRRYYQRELRSLSFPGNRRYCGSSCCVLRCAVWPRLPSRWGRPGARSASASEARGGSTDDGQGLAAADTSA
jgi:hypothetical protein